MDELATNTYTFAEYQLELVKGFEEVSVLQFTWSLDGKHLAYTAGQSTREIILIENFR